MGSRFSLSARIALVTGAARGIGRAIAEGLAEAGAAVVVSDLDHPPAEAAAAALAAAGARTLAVQADVTCEESVAKLVDTTVRWGGQLDLLVNNAGVTIQKPTEELTLEEWNRVLSVNLTGAFLCSRYASRIMIERGGGSIVNIGSIHAHVAPAFHQAAAYAAAKAGVLGLTRALAVEWGRHHIRVNAVCPTYVRTEMTKARFEDASYRSRILERTPLGEIAESSDIVGAVVFLASPAARMVTGQALNVDGGWLSI